jgi:hypothetical protein
MTAAKALDAERDEVLHGPVLILTRLLRAVSPILSRFLRKQTSATAIHCVLKKKHISAANALQKIESEYALTFPEGKPR